MNSVMKAWSDLPPIFADRLMALLSDPARAYSGLHRVNALLLEADRNCAPHWLRPLRWAILYHDAVPASPASARDRAQGSMELWLEHFPALHETVHGVSGQWEQDVATIILQGPDPFRRPAGLLPWQHAFLDLLCGEFGLAPDLYDANRLLMKTEAACFGLMPAIWIAARRDVVARALACPRLFHQVHCERETQARLNLVREDLALQRATP